MKSILLLFFIVSSISVLAQTANLKIENGKVSYEKIFEREGSKAKLFNEMRAWMTVNDVFMHERIVDSVIYASTAEFDCIIEFKDGRYRVQANNIKFGGRNQYGQVFYNAIEPLVLRKRNTEWRTGTAYKEAAQRADEKITSLFTIQTKTEDDW